MNVLIEVSVKFFSKEDGGREALPNLFGGLYRPHFVVFDDPKCEYLGVKFISQKSELFFSKETIATVELVYPGVNYSLLKNGVAFHIMEGNAKVGIGYVL